MDGILQDLNNKTQLVQSLRQEREIEDEDVQDARGQFKAATSAAQHQEYDMI